MPGVAVMAMVRRCDRWLLAPAPAERLALFRILVGGYAFLYLLLRLPPYLATAHLRDGFEPVGPLWFLDRPLPPLLVTVLVAAAPILALGFATGFRFRVSGPAFALVLLAVTTYRSSWGQLLYFDNLLVLHVLIVAFAPAADARTLRVPVSWPSRTGRSRTGRSRTGQPSTGRSSTGATPPSGPSEQGPGYGWPLRLCALVTVTTYVLAGVAKLRIGGLGWLDGSTLANHIAYSAARLEVLGGTPSPLAGPLLEHRWLLTPLAVATVALELGAPAALIPPVRTPWVAGLWLLHAAIAASMLVLFPYPLVLVAFAPLYPLERLVAQGRRARRPRPQRADHRSVPPVP